MSHEPDWRAIDRYLAGTAVPAEADAVRRWLEQHPREARLVDDLAPALKGGEPEWDTGSAWERMAASLPGLEEPGPRVLGEEPGPHALEPGARALEEGPGPGAVAWEERPVLTLQPHRHVRPRLVAGVALAAALGGILLWRAGAFAPAGGRPAALAELRTPAGRRATLRLADGTTVRLDAGSRLRYPARLTPGAARELYLDGQAFFAVKHDRARPFVVHAGGALVRDIGTEFGITAYAGAPAVRVVVAQGLVSVKARSGTRTVTPGQLASVDRAGLVDVRAADPRAYLGWTEGVLSFDERPLADVLPELSRWYGADIRVTDAALARRPLTAELRGESLEQALDAIALALGARWQRAGSAILLQPAGRP